MSLKDVQGHPQSSSHKTPSTIAHNSILNPIRFLKSFGHKETCYVINFSPPRPFSNALLYLEIPVFIFCKYSLLTLGKVRKAICPMPVFQTAPLFILWIIVVHLSLIFFCDTHFFFTNLLIIVQLLTILNGFYKSAYILWQDFN